MGCLITSLVAHTHLFLFISLSFLELLQVQSSPQKRIGGIGVVFHSENAPGPSNVSLGFSGHMFAVYQLTGKNANHRSKILIL